MPREGASVTKQVWMFEEIGKRIRHAREATSLRSGDLAQRVGLDRSSIVNIEAGRQKVTIDRLYAIADVLDVPIRDLLPPNRRPSQATKIMELPEVRSDESAREFLARAQRRREGS